MTTTTPFMHLVRPNVSAPAASSNASPCNVRIHTSAMLLVLEILSRQAAAQRVIGTLLGLRSDDGLEFEVRDAFMVPCTETGDQIEIEEATHKQLYQLYKKAHPKESVLGWFGLTLQIDLTTLLIHDFYSKGSDRAYPYPAIYLNVDFMSAARDELHVPRLTTYIAALVGQTSGPRRIGWKVINLSTLYLFTPVPNEVITKSVTEKLALLKLRLAPGGLVAISAEHDRDFLALQLQAVTENIDKLLAYVAKAKQGDSDELLDLLRLLSNNLLTNPQSLIELDALKDKFKAYNQDVIMIEYLTKAIKEQIELSARLTAEADKK